MAAETHGGGPRDEIIRVSSETRKRLHDWGDVAQHDDEVLQELLDLAELETGTATWPAGDYY